MTNQIKYKDITWIDLKKPSKSEVNEASRQLNIHPIAASELTSRSSRSKIDFYGDFIYLVLHFPNHSSRHRSKKDPAESLEIDFIVGRNYIITASYDDIEPMQEFGKIFETNASLSDSEQPIHAGHLLYFILRHLYQSFEQSLDSLNFELKKAETKVFSGEEKNMVRVLAGFNKTLLDYRSTLKAHREIIKSLEHNGREFFGESFAYQLRAISSEHQKAWDSLENNREFFAEIKQTNEELLTIKTNELMKMFSMLAFVTFPLTLIATILGLRSPKTPLVDAPYGFWLILGLMVALVCLMMAFFKHKKWL